MRRNASQQNQSHLREVQNAAAVAPQPPAEAAPPSVGQTPPPYHDLQALFRSPVLLLAGDFTEVEAIRIKTMAWKPSDIFYRGLSCLTLFSCASAVFRLSAEPLALVLRRARLLGLISIIIARSC